MSGAANIVLANEPVGFNYETEKPTGSYPNTKYWVNDKAIIVFRNDSSTCCGVYTVDEKEELNNDEKNIAEIIARYEFEDQIEIPSVLVVQGKEGEHSTCYKLESFSSELQSRILSEINLKIKTQKFDSKEKLKCIGVVL